MSTNYIPGLDSYGFCIPVEPEDAFADFMASTWEQAESHGGTDRETRCLKSDYSSLWMHYHDGALSTVLEVGNLPGMVGMIQSLPERKQMLVTLVDAHDPSEMVGVGSITVRIQSAQPWLEGFQPSTEQLPLSLTMTAQDARFFPNEESLTADPEFGEYGTQFLTPMGSAVDETILQAFATGKVLLAIETKNQLTGDTSWALRVRTFGGEIWIALPRHAVPEDVSGQFIVVQGILSGSFPDLMPKKQTEEEKGSLDFTVFGHRLRELVPAYLQSDDAWSYYTDIHPPKAAITVAKGVGLFNKSMRDAAKNAPQKRILDGPEIRARYVQVAATGHVIFARFVMANTELIEDEASRPSLVVIAFGDEAETLQAMEEAGETLSRIHFSGADDTREQELEALIEDEEYHFGRRRRLPEWLVGNVEAYAADLWIPKESIDLELMLAETIVCIAEPGPSGLTMAAPQPLVAQAMEEQMDKPSQPSGPPPVPPQVPPSTPPPIPGRGATPPPIPR